MGYTCALHSYAHVYSIQIKPFLKPNDKPECVNKLSNHPPEILKNIPVGINKQLVSISASKEVFENATQIYSDELVKCGYDHKLTYNNQNTHKKKRRRQRKISWFKPPFSKNVSTNIGAKFLKIIDEKIPEDVRKYFNRNTIKVSYRCMLNMKNYIDMVPCLLICPTVPIFCFYVCSSPSSDMLSSFKRAYSV